jgi:hypothetical protein
MTNRWSATYGQSAIPDQPNTHGKKKSRNTVSLTPAEARVLSHVAHIYRKLGATSRAEAVRQAESAGLLPRP